MSHTHTPKIDLYKPELDDKLGDSLTGFNANSDILDESVLNAVRGDLTAGSSKITVGGAGADALIGAGASVDVVENQVNHNSLLNTHNLTTDVDHDALTNFVANEHIDHSAVSIINGNGITGGGDLTANRTLSLTPLTSDWDIGDGRMIQADKIRARDGDGLALYEDGGYGLSFADGGLATFTTDGASTDVLVVSGNRNNGYRINVKNASNGNIALAGFYIQNDLNKGLQLHVYGSGYTPGTWNLPNRVVFRSESDMSNGLAFIAGAGGLHLYTGATERLTILHGGQIGIGTTAPSAQLAINGGLHVGGDSDPGDNNLLVDGTLQFGSIVEQQIYNTYVKKIQKTVILTNATATTVLTITTTNEAGDTDGGAYIVNVKGMVSNGAAANNTYVASKSFYGTFTRSIGRTGEGVNSAVTEVYESASAATNPAGRDIGTVTMTVTEVSEYEIAVQFTVNDIGGSPQLRMTFEAELVWYGFLTAPVMS